MMIKRIVAMTFAAVSSLLVADAAVSAPRNDFSGHSSATVNPSRYRGVHFGKHPVTTYEVIVNTREEDRSRQRVWISDAVRTHDGDEAKTLVWQVNVEREPLTGAPIFERMALPSLGAGYEFRVANGKLSGFVTVGGRRVDLPQLAIPAGAPVIGGVFSLSSAFLKLPFGLNLTLPLRVVDISDGNTTFVLKPFMAKVLGRQSYQLAGKSVPAFRISLQPMDGSPLYSGTVLVSEASPHVMLRSEIVAAYDGAKKEVISTGTEAMVETEPTLNSGSLEKFDGGENLVVGCVDAASA